MFEHSGPIPLDSTLVGQGLSVESLDKFTPEVLKNPLKGADLSLAAGDSLTALKVNEGLSIAKSLLSQFAVSSGFTDQLEIAFGNEYDRDIAQAVGLQWAKDNFGDLPQIQVLSSEEMRGANGAFAISTNTIYLSKEFVDHSGLNSVVSVIVEEIGHSVDARINSVDAAGDEGEIFSDVVQNKTLDNAQLGAFKVEDDHGLIEIGGVQVAIEKADGFTGNEKWTEIGYGGAYGTFFADVTGDGKADAIVCTNNSNNVTVRRSTGSGFSGNERWTEIPFAGQYGTWLADVTGDGKADLIASNSDGIYIRRSDGNRFLGNEKWTEISYRGYYGTFFADVTGDGKADAIVSTNNGNNVTVRRSTGNGFSGNERWTEIPFAGQNGTFFADVTGDGKADAIASNSDGVYIRRSTGSSFSGNEKWTEIGYSGAYGTFFADVTGDGKADAIVSTNNSNNVTVRRSTGSGFSGNERWTDIPFAGSAGTWFADVTGDRKADAIASNSDGIYIRRSGIVNPPDYAGNSIGAARDLGTLNSSRTYGDWVGNADTNDYYRFTVGTRSNFSLSLTGLSSDADVQLLNSSGGQLAISEKSGSNSESISNQLSAGTYFVRVYQYSGDTNYNLSLNVTPINSGGSINPNITSALNNLLGIRQITDPWGNYPGQCVSLVKRYTQSLGITMNPMGGNGGALYGFLNYNKPNLSLSASQADKFTFTGNEQPNVGDIIFFNATSSNAYGHVAIVQSVFGDGRVIIEESNGDGKALTTGTYVTRREINLKSNPPAPYYGSVMGWLRLKL